jgi:flagellar basal body-associated protein FliL
MLKKEEIINFLKDKKKIILIVSAFLIVTVTTILIYALSSTKKVELKIVEPAEVIVELKDPDDILEGAVLRMDPFVLNLKDNSGILRLKVTLVFYEFELPKSLSSLMPMYRDRIITTASSYNANDLLKPKNRNKFKTKLIEELNSGRSDEERIVDIYLEEFNIREL